MTNRPLFSLVLAVTLFAMNSFAQAATLSLSNVPLYLGGSVAPNVVLTLDDSGSMQWENMPDDNWTYYLYPRPTGVYGPNTYGNYVPRFEDITYSVRIRSSYNNKIYYNPAVTYIPWSNADGSSMGNVSPNCAPHNPNNTALGCRNLTQNNNQYANWEYYNGNEAGFPGGVSSWYYQDQFWPAVYYKYTGGDSWSVSSYQKVEIRSGSNYVGGPDREDCANAPVCSYQEEIQNFANWYSYYRSRILAARAGIGRAFGSQGQGMRVGFAAINQGGKTLDNVWSNQAMITGVRPFSGADRDNFFDQLYGRNIGTSGTPLRSATKNVGDYYERTDNRGPWGETPGTDDNTDQLTCRQSYNILMTDGYWNGSDPSVSNSDNN
ncbi:MAG: pilus assembly protein PilC, partial [Pseudomonadota bacterium]|nr:pilus assembly protein PilC [Pseudomonadota bacterium]